MNTLLTDPLASIPKWFRDHSPAIDDTRLATLKSCVVGLADADDLELSELVMAAYQEVGLADLEALDHILVSCTPTYAADRHKDEVCSIAAAAAIVMMSAERMDAGQDDLDNAVLTALLVESAAFSGKIPAIPELLVASKECLRRSSSRARTRLRNDTAAKAISRLAKVESRDETVVPEPHEMYQLLLERDKAINGLVSRLEQLVTSFNQRLDLLDEEVDVLWWARSGTSTTTGSTWTDLPVLERAVVATREAATLVKSHPPTFGTLAALGSVVGADEEEHDIVDVVSTLNKYDLQLNDDVGAFLAPLAAGLAIYRQFNGKRDVVTSALEATGSLDPATRYSAGQVAEQLFRELSIEALG